MSLIAKNTDNANERVFFFKLRDATDKITPEDVTVGDITCLANFSDGSTATLSTAVTKIDGTNGIYRGTFTKSESNAALGNGYVKVTCTGCDPEPVGFTLCLQEVYAASSSPTSIATEVLSQATSTPIHAAVQSVAANAITTNAFANGALTAAKFASGAFDAVWTVSTRTLSSFGTLVADTAAAVWNTLTSGLTTTGSIGKRLADNVDAAVSTRATASELALVKAVIDKVNTMLTASGGNFTFTVDALKNAPVGEGGGGGVADWTSTERAQIRYRLGIEGTATQPGAGAIPNVQGMNLPAVTRTDVP